MTSGIMQMQITNSDVKMIAASGAHRWPNRSVGFLMRQYIYEGKHNDPFAIIDVRKMWEKLVLAARAICAIENPSDICVIGSKPEVQRAILKFAHYTGAIAIAGKFTPGSFTNQITKAFKEPRIIVVSNTMDDQQAIKEASYVNIPVIAFASPASSIRCVDIAIPCNNAPTEASGLMWWFLCREVMRLKGSIPREIDWDVMVDLFIHREQENKDKQQVTIDAGEEAPQVGGPGGQVFDESKMMQSEFGGAPGMMGTGLGMPGVPGGEMWQSSAGIQSGTWSGSGTEWTSTVHDQAPM